MNGELRQATHRRRSNVVKRAAMPNTLIAGIIIALLLILAMLAGQISLKNSLEQIALERQAAYDRVVSAHPLFYRGLIEKYAAENNLQPAFVASIIMAESSYRADAVSKVGARGLMQVMPETAQWIAQKLNESETYNVDQLFDPETNIRYGTWYLNYLSQKFDGDPVFVASSYHAGQGEVQNWRSGGVESLADIQEGPTKNYAGKVSTAYGVYERLYFALDAEIGALDHQY